MTTPSHRRMWRFRRLFGRSVQHAHGVICTAWNGSEYNVSAVALDGRTVASGRRSTIEAAETWAGRMLTLDYRHGRR